MILEEFEKYHEVDLLDFQKYIKSIGFKYNGHCYRYKDYIIDLYEYSYDFYNGSRWVGYDYNDLTPLENEFKQELRRIKIKQILNNNRIIKI